jgi:hypothetical protein
MMSRGVGGIAVRITCVNAQRSKWKKPRRPHRKRPRPAFQELPDFQAGFVKVLEEGYTPTLIVKKIVKTILSKDQYRHGSAVLIYLCVNDAADRLKKLASEFRQKWQKSFPPLLTAPRSVDHGRPKDWAILEYARVELASLLEMKEIPIGTLCFLLNAGLRVSDQPEIGEDDVRKRLKSFQRRRFERALPPAERHKFSGQFPTADRVSFAPVCLPAVPRK